MLKTQAVGIDLGTTYSCLSYLNEHGEPVTLANQEGELSTPSVVLFDKNEIVVGTEALRNAVVKPNRVVQNSKRFIGDPNHRWVIDGKKYTPVDIAALILKKLLLAAKEQIGPIEQAVVTVPALFSEIQRQATVEAGIKAGLKHVDIINEPVAAALCYVLGTEGLWFTELADEQRILVYDLGGGTFDLSLVKYQKNEVSVIASSGDLNLGGIDWNQALETAIINQFLKEFGEDPRTDPESLQFLALEVENVKRGLTVRPRAALTCQHAGHRKTYQVEQAQFEKLTQHLVSRTGKITQAMLKDNEMGWAHVDVVLTTGGSSRMPMVRNALKELGGRTLNTSLSPDQSIAHGATYYAGMLLTNSEYAKSILNEEATERLAQIKQRSVNARALGILIRDTKLNKRIPHYLIPGNTPLPTSITQTFGTVIKNQKRVHLHIVESGTSEDQPAVKLGACVVDNLPADLREGSEIAVTISYDDQARVHVSAKDVTSGKQATTEIVREENLVSQPAPDTAAAGDDFDISSWSSPSPKSVPNAKASPAKAATPQASAAKPAVKPAAKPKPGKTKTGLDEASRPVPLCNKCGDPLDVRGQCPSCGTKPKAKSKTAGNRPTKPVAQPASKKSQGKVAPQRVPAAKAAARPAKLPPPSTSIPTPVDDDDIIELESTEMKPPGRKPIPAAKASGQPQSQGRKPSVKAPPVPPPLSQGTETRKAKRRGGNSDAGEDEFWQLAD